MRPFIGIIFSNHASIWALSCQVSIDLEREPQEDINILLLLGAASVFGFNLGLSVQS